MNLNTLYKKCRCMRNTYIHKIVSILVIAWLTFFSFTNAYEYSNAITFQGAYNIWTEALWFKVIEWNWNISVNGLGAGSCSQRITNITNWDEYFFEEIGCGVNWTFWSNNTITIKFIYPDPPMVQWGTDAFSGAINKLWTYAGEIMPYMLYIGLWALGVSILFVALKRILNRIKRKTFKSIR